MRLGAWMDAGGCLGQTFTKHKPKKVQLVVFLSKTGTYPSLLLGMQRLRFLGFSNVGGKKGRLHKISIKNTGIQSK